MNQTLEVAPGDLLERPAEGPSVVRLPHGIRRPTEVAGVRNVLAHHFGDEVVGEAMVPPVVCARLRGNLRAAAPELSALSTRVTRAFTQGACGVLITDLGLIEDSIDDTRKMIYALSVLLGDVVWTHPVDNRVIWDVANKSSVQHGAVQHGAVQHGAASLSTDTRHSTFSENDQEAEYHTDASFSAVPDHYFLLYSVRAATCGGGQTFVTDGRRLSEELRQTTAGREALRVLTQTRFPMRVPKAFRARANLCVDGHSYEPVISDGPVWRFRKDKLEKGLVKYPDYATDEVRTALDTVYEALRTRDDEYRDVIPTDAVLIVDNHVALHGRTAFRDHRRHLLRARFDKPAG